MFINEYVKGGWALGINPYEEYKDKTKTGLPSWEEADNIYDKKGNMLPHNQIIDIVFKTIDKLSNQSIYAKDKGGKYKKVRVPSTNDYYRKGKHNWMDAKGFEYRTAYAETKDGTILEIILNIGRCANGTYIVYDISNIKEVARAVEPLKNGNINPKTTFKNRKYHKNNDKSSKLNQDRNILKPGPKHSNVKTSMIGYTSPLR